MKLVVITVANGLFSSARCMNAGIDAVGGDRKPDAAGMIGDPAGDVAGILRQQRQFLAVEIDPIDVEHFRVAPVQRDQDFVVILVAVVDDHRPHFVERREVDKVSAVGVDCNKVKILVALEILQVDDAARALPEITGDIALGFAGDAYGLPAGARPHEHVHAVLIGLHERDGVPVRRELEGGLLRIAEEIAQRNACSAARGGWRHGRTCGCSERK